MALGAALFSLNTLAQMTPLGTWHTIDDETKKPKGEVRITLSPSGGLSGVVEKSLMSILFATCALMTGKANPKSVWKSSAVAKKWMAKMCGMAAKSSILKTARTTVPV